MRSSFFGLHVATGGLYSAQRNLDIINHNISNLTTPGYSRQMGVQQASRPMSFYDGRGMIGTGSEVASVQRVRDDFLDFKLWSENVSLGEWSVKKDQMSEVERLFNEPSVDGSGFNKIMDDFYKSLEELSKNPANLSLRKIVINRGVSMAKYFNSLGTRFEKMQSDVNNAVKQKVGEVNSLAEQIGQLNRQIYTLEVDGSIANDLRDQRTQLVNQLSALVNVDVNEVTVGKLANGREDKHFTVSISGKNLVDHLDVSPLKVTQRSNKQNDEDIPSLYDVSWVDGNSVEIRGGEIKGYLDIRDGNEGENGSPMFKGVPFYIKKLNTFVRKFAMSFNEGIIEKAGGGYEKAYPGHADGFGLQKPGTTAEPTGVRFFSIRDMSALTNEFTELDTSELIGSASTIGDIAARYDKLTAKNFCISGDLLNQQYAEYNLAASSGSGLTDDNKNVLKWLEMRHDSHLFTEGTPEDYMKSLVGSMGIDSQQAVQLYKGQELLTKQIENRIQSVSGVSVDEELGNMVKFQHAYNAAAKMVNTMSEIYDTLINRLGVSGR